MAVGDAWSASPPRTAAPLELWAGLECTLNRVGNEQYDQLELLGAYARSGDLERLASLNIRTLRFPILWERFAGRAHDDARWVALDAQMATLQRLGIDPIVGLLHHGSGPMATSLLHRNFADGLAAFARTVAERYPWVTRYTPINEPLTTARFSTLYGAWFPHARSDVLFLRAMLNQARATCLAMAAIRSVNPAAQLVQTEDLGRVRSTPLLRYQADFENERRWLTFDLLDRRVTAGHAMYEHAGRCGVSGGEIADAVGDGCTIDVIGINHYVTSDRWLDERLDRYPEESHGGNYTHRYADVAAVRVVAEGAADRCALLLEAWRRYHLPLAITEVHLGCTREQQMRWLHDGWKAACDARDNGADVRAVTAWAAFGTRDWTSLVTRLNGDYEPGLFDVRSPTPRPTALATMVRSLASGGDGDHPVLHGHGWWRAAGRFSYGDALLDDAYAAAPAPPSVDTGRPLLITGASGMLGEAVVRLCAERGLASIAASRRQLDVTDGPAVQRTLRDSDAWAVVNCAGFTRIDAAEREPDACHATNVDGTLTLAHACAEHGVPILTFSSELVFDGRATRPYVESSPAAPLGVYGRSKATADARLLDAFSSALVVRTAALFGPWDERSVLARAMRALDDGATIEVADDVVVSPTFLPDLVHTALDLLIDGERGVWHLVNDGETTLAEFVRTVGAAIGVDCSRLQGRPHAALAFTAPRPRYSALTSERGTLMPTLQSAVRRYAGLRTFTTTESRVCSN